MKKIEKIQKIFLYLSIPQAIETLIAAVLFMAGVVTFLMNELKILFGVLVAIIIFAIISIFVNRQEKTKLSDRVDVPAIEKAYVGIDKDPAPPFPIIKILLHIRNGTEMHLNINKIDMYLKVNDRFLANINESNIGTIAPYDLDFSRKYEITAINQAIPDFKEYTLWIEASGKIEFQSAKVKIEKGIEGNITIAPNEWQSGWVRGGDRG